MGSTTSETGRLVITWTKDFWPFVYKIKARVAYRLMDDPSLLFGGRPFVFNATWHAPGKSIVFKKDAIILHMWYPRSMATKEDVGIVITHYDSPYPDILGLLITEVYTKGGVVLKAPDDIMDFLRI